MDVAVAVAVAVDVDVVVAVAPLLLLPLRRCCCCRCRCAVVDKQIVVRFGYWKVDGSIASRQDEWKNPIRILEDGWINC